jgi:hypothetical protein
MILAGNALAATNVTNGLYAWWKLDEGSGTDVADSSGNGHSGKFTNSPSWTTGQLGNAVRFNGTANQSILMTNATDNFTTFTIAFWIKEIGTTFHGYVISKQTYDSTVNGWLVMSESGQLRYSEGDVDVNNWIETSDRNPDAYITDGAWHHFVCTRNGVSVVNSTTNAVSYKDGVIIGGPLTYAGSTVTSIANSSYMRVGYGTAFDGSCCNAIIDDVRVYSRVLDLGEITNVFQWDGVTGAGINRTIGGRVTIGGVTR